MIMNSDFNFMDEDLDADVDLTALIDVIFMLLIFFVVASTFIKPAMEVQLPETKSAQSSGGGTGELCIVTITADGDVFFDDEPVAFEEIAQFIKQHKESRLDLYIDEAAPFLPVLRIMDEAKVQDHADLIITTQKTKS